MRSRRHRPHDFYAAPDEADEAKAAAVMIGQIPERESRWNDIEASLGTLSDTGHAWDDDATSWIRAQAGRLAAVWLIPDVQTRSSRGAYGDDSVFGFRAGQLDVYVAYGGDAA